jgi:hypothetical protein
MALNILTAIAVILALKYAQAIFLPVVLGVLISKALTPLVNRAVGWRLPRSLAAAIVMSAVLAASGLLLYELRDQADAVVRQLPEAAQRLRRTVEREKRVATTAIEQMQKAATELERAADAAAGPKKSDPGITRVQVEPGPLNVTDYVWWGAVSLASMAGQFVMILFLAYFLLASGDLYRRKIVKIAGPSLAQKRVTLQILEQIDQQIPGGGQHRGRLRELARLSLAGSGTGRRLGPSRRRVQFDSLFRAGGGDRWHDDCRISAVRHDRDGGARGRRRPRHHDSRGVPSDAVVDEPCREDERGRGVYRADLLGMGMGGLGSSPGRADAGRHQGGL